MSGFAQTQPKGRAVRQDKDTQEKEMIKARSAGYQRNSEVYDGPITVPDKSALGFQGDAERFQTDAAAADAEVRAAEQMRKQDMYANRR